jgi:beta-ribofuranosylaminobenzene 5'-phosphate synthase
MSTVRIQTPSRLHFGLLGWGPHAARQFGGLGLMIESPHLRIAADFAEKDTILAHPGQIEKRLALIETIRHNLKARGQELPAVRFTFENEMPSHHGLGSGTQTTLAMAEAALIFAGHENPTKDEIIAAAGRFPRSGVGTHGYFAGGLIVDEGHPQEIEKPTQPARLFQRIEWPEDWHVVTICPPEHAGPSGNRESAAFETLPNPTVLEMRYVSDLLRNVFLPAIDPNRSDFDSAMDSLEAIQKTIGGWFAPAQGGHVYGSAQRDRIVGSLRAAGLRGLGQSSWGPTLFGFSREDANSLEIELNGILDQAGVSSKSSRLQICRAENRGRRILGGPAGSSSAGNGLSP